MELVGQIEDIIYRNESNSYCVATFVSNEELLTVVGYLPFIHSGDTLQIVGEMVQHIEYGEQFKITTFEKILPQTLEALEKYLANGMIKGIGPSTARKIVQTFGEETIDVLKMQPEKLAIVKGITKEKAKAISEEFNQNMEIWQLVHLLEKFGLSVNHAKMLYDALGNKAMSEIEENPYRLIDLIKGVDFKQVDRIALDLGFSQYDEKRIQSGMKYGLNQIALNGHCCTLKENLYLFVKNLLQIESEEIENQFMALTLRKEMFIQTRDGQEWVYLYPFHKAEIEVAQNLLDLRDADKTKKIPNIKKEIQTIEKEQEIQLSEEQKEAIYQMNDQNVCVITGGPGTGKTTIIKTLIEILKKHGKKVVLCAPTRTSC